MDIEKFKQAIEAVKQRPLSNPDYYTCHELERLLNEKLRLFFCFSSEKWQKSLGLCKKQDSDLFGYAFINRMVLEGKCHHQYPKNYQRLRLMWLEWLGANLADLCKQYNKQI